MEIFAIVYIVGAALGAGAVLGVVVIAVAIGVSLSQPKSRPVAGTGRARRVATGPNRMAASKTPILWVVVGVILFLVFAMANAESVLRFLAAIGGAIFLGNAAAIGPLLAIFVIMVGIAAAVSARSRPCVNDAEDEHSQVGEEHPPQIQGHFPPDELRLMLEHSISFDGSHFQYGGYRYDKLQDAVAYAKLMAKRNNPAGHSTNDVPAAYHSVNRTPCRPCRQVPSALRAPVAGYVER